MAVPTAAVLIAFTSSVGSGVAPIVQAASIGMSAAVNKVNKICRGNFRTNIFLPPWAYGQKAGLEVLFCKYFQFYYTATHTALHYAMAFSIYGVTVGVGVSVGVLVGLGVQVAVNVAVAVAVVVTGTDVDVGGWEL